MIFEPKVGIIIANWNRPFDTIECIKSLFDMDYKNFHIILLDNGSSDNSLDLILDNFNGYVFELDIANREINNLILSLNNSEYFNVILNNLKRDDVSIVRGLITIIKLNKNVGYAKANNIAIKICLNIMNPDYLWLLNNDTVVDKKSLTNLVSEAENDKSALLLGSKILNYYKKNIIDSAGGRINTLIGRVRHIGFNEPDDGRYNVSKYVDYVTGCSVLVRKLAIGKIGYIPEDYFLYFEDTEWCIKARKLGYRVKYIPSSIVYHKISKSTNRMTRNYYFALNNLKFEKKNYPYFFPVALFYWVIRFLCIPFFKNEYKDIAVHFKAFIKFLNLKIP